MIVGEDAGRGGPDRVGRLLGRLHQVLGGLVGAVGPHPDHAGIENLVDDRREVLLREYRLALGVQDDGVRGREIDEADVVAVGLLRAPCRSSRPGRRRRPCSRP